MISIAKDNKGVSFGEESPKNGTFTCAKDTVFDEWVAIDGNVEATDYIRAGNLRVYSGIIADAPDRNNSWIRLGRLKFPESAFNALLTIYSGQGYNGTADSVTYDACMIEAVIRKNSGASLSNDKKWSSKYWFKGSAAITSGLATVEVRCRYIDDDTCDVYVYLPWQWRKGFYKIECHCRDVLENYNYWIHGGETSSSFPVNSGGSVMSTSYSNISPDVLGYPVDSMKLMTTETGAGSPADWMGGIWTYKVIEVAWIADNYCLNIKDGNITNSQNVQLWRNNAGSRAGKWLFVLNDSGENVNDRSPLTLWVRTG